MKAVWFACEKAKLGKCSCGQCDWEVVSRQDGSVWAVVYWRCRGCGSKRYSPP